MTPDEIRLIEERCSKATAGKWRVSDTSIVSEHGTDNLGYCIAVIEDDGGYEAPAEQQGANAEFIAHARTDLPALVQEVKRLTEEVAERDKLLIAAMHALRSYQNGNASLDLAEEIADRIREATQ